VNVQGSFQNVFGRRGVQRGGTAFVGALPNIGKRLASGKKQGSIGVACAIGYKGRSHGTVARATATRVIKIGNQVGGSIRAQNSA